MSEAFKENSEVWMVVRTNKDADMNPDDRKRLLADNLTETEAKEYKRIMKGDKSIVPYQEYEELHYPRGERLSYFLKNNIDY